MQQRVRSAQHFAGAGEDSHFRQQFIFGECQNFAHPGRLQGLEAKARGRKSIVATPHEPDTERA